MAKSLKTKKNLKGKGTGGGRTGNRVFNIQGKKRHFC